VVTGEETIRPRAKTLRVADRNLTDSQELVTFPSGLALPTLIVETSR
jgi:hypothetical protein